MLLQLRRRGRFDAVILQRKLLPGWQLRALAGLHGTLSLILTTPSSSATLTTGVVRRAAGVPDDSRRRSGSADTVVAGNDFLADCALRDGAMGGTSARDSDLRGTAALSDRPPRARRRPCRPRLDWFGEHA